MDSQFLPAEVAIATGDADALERLIAERPQLATARSSCSHPTLLQCLVLTVPPPPALERMIRSLVDRGAEKDQPLIAAGSCNERAVAALLELGATIDGDARWSSLEEALYWNHAPSVDVLIARGAAVDNLRKAAALGRDARVREYFGADGLPTAAAGEVAWPFGTPIAEALRRDPQQIVDNALIYAAAWGRDATVDLLLERGARVDAIPAGFDFAATALHYAAMNGRAATVEHLLRLGADPSIQDPKVNQTPEGWATHGEHPELAERLRRARVGR